ncbi:hypothetical protein JZ751_004494 [Albula glossodonta]|uniref:Matrin-3-like n=1 Tax=Albula glossodonta TaxID=121402 RepID=A0A8T2MN95_9TELE|nr:hypothetical protein JZ751_004494 [Albula glossodonta]
MYVSVSVISGSLSVCSADKLYSWIETSLGLSMEEVDQSDQEMNSERPGPSKSGSSSVERGDEGQGSSNTHMSTLNLYSTLGLSPEDVDALAQIPENEISIETLPRLIMQLKAKRAEQGRRKEKTRNDPEEDWDGGSPGSGTRRSASKSPVHSHSTDYDCNYSKYESHEHSEHTRGRREPHHSKSSHERPYSPLKFPLSYMIDDMRGTLPRSFPHTCSLCRCTLNSAITWKDHLNGSRHDVGRREFLRTHPDWDPQDRSSRILDSRSSAPRRRPYSSDCGSGEWPLPPPDRHLHLRPKVGTKVVVTKFLRGSVGVEDLLSLAKPFGTVVKHLVFPCKGFLEFSTHKEAASMVSHYAAKPAFVKENRLALYLSPMTPKLDKVEKRPKRLSPAVVCFSHVPSDKESEAELLQVAKMFGEVRYCKVSTNEALIEMEDSRDAEIMVKYYHTNPLKICGKNVRVSLSSSHKRLRLSPDPFRRGDSSRSHSSSHKNKEVSRSSHSKNKEKASSQKEVMEKKIEFDEEESRTLEESDCVDISVEGWGEDGEGLKVEDELGLLEEEFDQVGTVDEEIPLEPFAGSNASEKEVSEGSGEEVEDILEQDTIAEEPPLNSDGNLDEASTFQTPEEEKTLVEDAESTMKEKLEELHESEEGGKVVTVRRIRKGYGLEEALLKLAEPFGKVTNHAISFYRQECYIQMETADAAQKMVQKYLQRPPKFYGSVLRICLCRKGDSQIPWRAPTKYELWCAQNKLKKSDKETLELEVENGQSAESPAAQKTPTEEDVKSTVSDSDGVSSAPASDTPSGENGDKDKKTEHSTDTTPVPLGPYQPDNPVGIDYIVQRTGFFCKLCKVFYTNEKTAKSLHCSSLAHYQKLKMVPSPTM